MTRFNLFTQNIHSYTHSHTHSILLSRVRINFEFKLTKVQLIIDIGPSRSFSIRFNWIWMHFPIPNIHKSCLDLTKSVITVMFIILFFSQIQSKNTATVPFNILCLSVNRFINSIHMNNLFLTEKCFVALCSTYEMRRKKEYCFYISNISLFSILQRFAWEKKKRKETEFICRGRETKQNESQIMWMTTL